MLYECKVMRPGDVPHDWVDAACFGWRKGGTAWTNDGPAVEAASAVEAAEEAARRAVRLGLVLDTRLCVVARSGDIFGTFGVAVEIVARADGR